MKCCAMPMVDLENCKLGLFGGLEACHLAGLKERLAAHDLAHTISNHAPAMVRGLPQGG
jgi:hypothetical protein